MPKRMLHGEVTRSESLAAVSLEANLTFFLLMSRADDHGRFDGRPMILLAELFPLRHDVSLEALSKWTQELVSARLLHAYKFEGRPYLHFPTWGKYQRLREAAKSKWPDPTECCGDAAGRGDALHMAASGGSEARSEKREARSGKTEKSVAAAPPRSARDLRSDLQQVWPDVGAAFVAYGKPLPKLTTKREAIALARLRDEPEESADVLVRAIHGRMRVHQRANGYDPLDHLTPESVFRPGNFRRDVEACDAAIASGEAPPYTRATTGAAPKFAHSATPFPKTDAEVDDYVARHTTRRSAP